MRCTYERPLKRGRATTRCNPSDRPETSADANAGIQHQRQTQLQYQNQDSYRQRDPGRLRSVTQVRGSAPTVAEAAQSASPSLGSTSRGFVTSRKKQKKTQELYEDGPATAWGAFAAASAGAIEYLVDVYLQVVYPM